MKTPLLPLRLAGGITDGIRRAWELVVPGTCHFCDALLFRSAERVPALPEYLEDGEEAYFPEDLRLCRECLEALRPEIAHRCRFCGAKNKGRLHDCEQAKYSLDVRHLGYDRVIPLDDYRLRLREAILRMKLPRYDGLSASLARLYGFYHEKQLRHLRLDFIVPVPMHRLTRMARGTSSPDIFAGILGKTLGLPVFPGLLRVNRLTKLQRSLKMEEREANVAGCFSVRYPFLAGSAIREEFWRIFKNRRVLVVDDVLTTGATCAEVSRVLRTELGVTYVAVAVLAKARGRNAAENQKEEEDDW